jgi:hypothetical protein
MTGLRVDVVVSARQADCDALSQALSTLSSPLSHPVTVQPVSAGAVATPDDAPLVYLHDPAAPVDSQTNDALETAVQSRALVLPVIEDPPAAGSLPDALKPVNAFIKARFASGWADALADELLSHLWVGRTTRKIFISYKRTDSQEVANQLHERLTKLQFDAFLDECAIPYGADFQRELEFRLNDTDLVLLLASPNFANSDWTLREVEFAKSAQIGILAVLWPGVVTAVERREDSGIVNLVNRIFASDRQALAHASFVSGPDSELSPDWLEKIVHACLRARTDALVRRLHHLLPLARRRFAGIGAITNGSRLGELAVADSAEKTLVKVLPFRPDLAQMYRFYSESSACSPALDRIGCFYAENDPKNAAVSALRWGVERSADRGKPAARVWPYVGSRLP